MAVNTSHPRPVTFLHLSCSLRNGVRSLVAEALAVEVRGSHEGREVWVARAVRLLSASELHQLDQLRRTLPSLRGQTGERGICGREELVDARMPVSLFMYCRKCCVNIAKTSGALVLAARRHPDQVRPGSSINAYIADQGEVVYRHDHYAESLVARDRRAKRTRPRNDLFSRGGAHVRAQIRVSETELAMYPESRRATVQKVYEARISSVVRMEVLQELSTVPALLDEGRSLT